MYLPRNLGRLLFGVWLIVMALVAATDLKFAGINVVLGMLLVGAGVATLLGK
jgi:hypothetical protein